MLMGGHMESGRQHIHNQPEYTVDTHRSNWDLSCDAPIVAGEIQARNIPVNGTIGFVTHGQCSESYQAMDGDGWWYQAPDGDDTSFYSEERVV